MIINKGLMNCFGLVGFWFLINIIIWPIALTIGDLTIKLYFYAVVAICIIWMKYIKSIAFSIKFLLTFLFIFAFIYFLPFAWGTCEDLHIKSLSTFPIFIFLSILSWHIGRKSSPKDWLDLVRLSQLIIFFIAFEFLMEFLFPQFFLETARYRDVGKLSGFFNEPSHVAFSIFPCIAVIFTSPKIETRITGLLAIFMMVVLSASSTLLILMLIWIIFFIFLEVGKVSVIKVFFLTFITAFILLLVDIDYFFNPLSERLSGVFSNIDENSNISSLVYIQGIQDAWINLKRTYGFGLGLNMMGCSPLPDSKAREVLESLNLSGLNMYDGSFLTAKLISEFGILGIIFLAFLILVFCNLIKQYKFSIDPLMKQSILIKALLIFIIFFIFFTRTSGYFGGPFFILIMVLGSIRLNTKFKINHEATRK